MTYEYATAFSHWGNEENVAINRVRRSGRYTTGLEVEALERDFERYHGMRHAIAVNSGSSANLVAVAALAEHELLLTRDSIPALSWATLYAPFAQRQRHFELRDCDDTWNAPSTIGGIACPVLGNPAHMDFGAYLMVDCCESLGARDEDGTLCGTRGYINTFSFYFSHQVSGIEGGMITTNDDALAATCRLLLNHGWRRGTTFETEYDFKLFGYNVRPVEMHAAIAREQLKKLDDMIAARWENYTYWLQAVQGMPIEHPRMSGKPSMFGIPFAVASKEIRSNLARALRAEGIDCRPPVGGSFTKHPYGEPWRDQLTPNADRIHDTGIFLGLAPYPIHDLIDKAVAVMRRVL